MIKPYYKEEGITIYCADCRDVLPQLEPVDLVLTDPPFAFCGGISNGFASRADSQFFECWLKEIFTLLHKKSTPESAWALWCDWRTAAIYDEVLGASAEDYYDQRRVTQVVIHDREMVGMGSPFRNQTDWIAIIRGKHTEFKNRIPKNQPNIFREYWYYGKHTNHPSEKSPEVGKKFIVWLSDQDGTILDPFMGSGTILVAAKSLGRKVIGIEIEQKYCDIAIERLKHGVFKFEERKFSASKQEEINILAGI